MARPCTCDNLPAAGQPYTIDRCRLCWLWHNDTSYRALWEQNGHTPVRCPYTGPEAKDDSGAAKTRECPSCNGRVRLKVFQCEHPAREPDEVTNDDCKVCPHRPRTTLNPRAVILKNHLSPGDVLVMTAALYSLHRAHPGKFVTAVDTTCPSVWDFNPDVVSIERARELHAEYLPWPKDGKGQDELYPAINQCNQHAAHFMEAYCQSIGKALGVALPLLTNRPHVYISNREQTWINQVEDTFGFKGKFWVVNAGVKNDFTCKQWPWYQQTVDALQGHIQFVQVGRLEHLHPPLRGVLDLRGKTDDRQLVRLVHHSSGVLCGTTFLMHLAAALQRPSVVLAGGREPRQWNQYPLSNHLSTVGALSCCARDACWKSRTVKLNDGQEQDNSLCEQPCSTEPPAPKCMAMIGADEVVAILRRHS